MGYGSKDELLCVTRSVLKKMKRQVLVGDFVEVSSVDWTLGHGVVKSVLPRQSIFQTPAVANVEIALVMFALTDPPIEANQVSRFLVAAEGAGLDSGVLVVLNKTDLVSREETKAWVDRLGSWGYRAIPVSASGGRGGRGVDALEGKLGVVVGLQRGRQVLVNQFHQCAAGGGGRRFGGVWGGGPRWTGEVSARTGRGKHTTRNISLIRLSNGGFLADTPGFNQPHLWGGLQGAPGLLPGDRPAAGGRKVRVQELLPRARAWVRGEGRLGEVSDVRGFVPPGQGPGGQGAEDGVEERDQGGRLHQKVRKGGRRRAEAEQEEASQNLQEAEQAAVQAGGHGGRLGLRP